MLVNLRTQFNTGTLEIINQTFIGIKKSRQGRSLITQRFIVGLPSKNIDESRQGRKKISIKNISLIVFNFVFVQKCQKLGFEIHFAVMFGLIINVIRRSFNIADTD